MKSKFILSLILGYFFFLSNPMYAQRGRGHGHGRGGRKVVVVDRHPGRQGRVRVVKYRRNGMVVVKRRIGRRITVLPVGYNTIIFKRRNYYYSNGLFYNYLDNNYVVIAPPRGIRIAILPPLHHRLVVASVPYFYYSGVYYKQVNAEYETVKPVVGSIVPDLPKDDVDEVTIDGTTYYEYDNYLYKAVVTDTGTQYEMVGKLK